VITVSWAGCYPLRTTNSVLRMKIYLKKLMKAGCKMKREKFLWPLSQSHHGALLLARKIRESFSGPKHDDKNKFFQELSVEANKFFKDELIQHFWDEERILGLFELRMGNGDPDVEKIRKDHRFLESLLSHNTQESLLDFAETLTHHIRFEEDVFFERIEKVFNELDKKLVGEILTHQPTLS
jgi:hypothetical protein